MADSDNYFFKNKKNIIIIVLLITIIVFGIIGYIYYNKRTQKSKNEKQNFNKLIEKELGVKNILINPKIVKVDNKIIRHTSEQKKQYLLEKNNFKHKTFINNINNSLDYCIENNKFDTAEYINKYKKIYIKLFKLNNDTTINQEIKKKQKKKYSHELTIINNTIRHHLNMNYN